MCGPAAKKHRRQEAGAGPLPAAALAKVHKSRAQSLAFCNLAFSSGNCYTRAKLLRNLRKWRKMRNQSNTEQRGGNNDADNKAPLWRGL